MKSREGNNLLPYCIQLIHMLFIIHICSALNIYLYMYIINVFMCFKIWMQNITVQFLIQILLNS